MYGFAAALMISKCCNAEYITQRSHLHPECNTDNHMLFIKSKPQRPQRDLTKSSQHVLTLYRHKHIGCHFVKDVFLGPCLLCWFLSRCRLSFHLLGHSFFPQLCTSWRQKLFLSSQLSQWLTWRKLNIQYKVKGGAECGGFCELSSEHPSAYQVQFCLLIDPQT